MPQGPFPDVSVLADGDVLGGRLGTAHAWAIGLCALFVLVTLAIAVRSRRTTRGAVGFYAGGRGFSSTQNGLALTGDYLSEASFLGIAGMLSPRGYDGFLYSIGFLVAWLLVLPMAQLTRNAGRFTTADLPAFRMRRMRVRLACTVSTVTVCVFYLMTPAPGFGAAALVGSERIAATDPSGNTAVPMPAEELGRLVAGPMGAAVLLALVSAVALATGLAVVAGLTPASSSSIAHDLFGHILMWGRPRESQEVGVARLSACVVGGAAILPAVQAREQNVAFLVDLAFAIAAAANLPVIVLTLFWRRFNTAGVEWTVYGGLSATLLSMLLSPVMSGKTDPVSGENLSVLPAWIDIQLLPMENPALIAVPLGFMCAVVGTLLSSERDTARFAELRVRSLTGWGADRD